MISRLRVLLAAVAIAVLAVGCGGDDGDSASSANANAGDNETVSTSSLDKAAYLAKVNALCSRGSERVLNYEAAPAAAETESELVPEIVDAVVVPAFQDVVDEIQALGAPAGDEAEVEALLAALQQGVDAVDRGGDSLSTLDDIEARFRRAGQLARAYGVPRCAYG